MAKSAAAIRRTKVSNLNRAELLRELSRAVREKGLAVTARQAGIPRSTLSRWRKQRRIPTRKKSLAKARRGVKRLRQPRIRLEPREEFLRRLRALFKRRKICVPIVDDLSDYTVISTRPAGQTTSAFAGNIHDLANYAKPPKRLMRKGHHPMGLPCPYFVIFYEVNPAHPDQYIFSVIEVEPR